MNAQALAEISEMGLRVKSMENIETKIIELIETIIYDHFNLINIALRQKAKFEGWLKFELASALEKNGAESVSVEYNYEGQRADISFVHNQDRYFIELKTSNTNWRIDGIEAKTRPITKNINSIIMDGFKLMLCDGIGLVVFLLFPIPKNDSRWRQYTDRISKDLGIRLIEDKNYKLLNIDSDSSCQILVSAVITET